MACLKLSMEIRPLEGFSKDAFVTRIARNLQEIDGVKLSYAVTGNKYIFEVEYTPTALSSLPILGCFSCLEQEYPYVKVLSTSIVD